MKNLKLLGLFLIVLIISSCGSGSNSDSSSKSENKKSNDVYQDDNLEVAIGEGWNMKKGPNGHSFYTWTIESSGDIYKDIEDQYSEEPSEVKEVMVDNLPALTKIKVYQQNEKMKERIWLIYNGNKLIQFSVVAPATSFNDELAQEVISRVKVKNREANVQLPEPKGKTYEKPEQFPDKMAEQLKGNFSDKAVLSPESMNNAKAFSQKLNELKTETEKPKGEMNMERLDSLAQTSNLESWSQYENVVRAAGASIEDVIGFMSDLEEMEEGSENYNLTLDATKQIIKQTNLSLEDVRFVYENWEMVTEFMNSLK